MIGGMIASVKKGVGYVYDKMHWFSDKEAWWMFRLVAITETIGWTMLIGAIIYRSFDLPFADSAVSFAGRVHGIFFVMYFAFVLATARSMGWGFWRVSGALAAGMPPFTSLIFEKIMAIHRKKRPVTIPLPRDYDK